MLRVVSSPCWRGAVTQGLRSSTVHNASDDIDILDLCTHAAALFKMEEVQVEIDKAVTKWVQDRLAEFDADLKTQPARP